MTVELTDDMAGEMTGKMTDNMLQLQQLRSYDTTTDKPHIHDLSSHQLCDLYPAVTSHQTTSFRRGHIRSPSDGDKPFIEKSTEIEPGNETRVGVRRTPREDTRKNPRSNINNKLNSSEQPSDKSNVGFLRRLFGIRSKSCTREAERRLLSSANKVPKPQIILPSDDYRNGNGTYRLATEKSFTLPASNRSSANNNNNGELVRNSYTLSTPPIAVFCSDEDISFRPEGFNIVGRKVSLDNDDQMRQIHDAVKQSDPINSPPVILRRPPRRRRPKRTREHRYTIDVSSMTAEMQKELDQKLSIDDRAAVQSTPAATASDTRLSSELDYPLPFRTKHYGSSVNSSPAHGIASVADSNSSMLWTTSGEASVQGSSSGINGGGGGGGRRHADLWRDVSSFDSGIQDSQSSAESLQLPSPSDMLHSDYLKSIPVLGILTTTTTTPVESKTITGKPLITLRPDGYKTPTGAPGNNVDYLSSKGDCCAPTDRIDRAHNRPQCIHWMFTYSRDLNLEQEEKGTNTKMDILKRPRPKSDLGSQALCDAFHQVNMNESFDTIGTLSDFSQQNTCKVNRRMSTPHPIKVRPTEKRVPTQEPASTRTLKRHLSAQLCRSLHRSNSAPDLGCKMRRSQSQRSMYPACPGRSIDVATRSTGTCSDDETGDDFRGMDTLSETSSIDSAGKQSLLDEIFDNRTTVLAEALWDHVTLDVDELGFEAGDVIQVSDMMDRNWWYGCCGSEKGWFPATFVRLRIVNDESDPGSYMSNLPDHASSLSGHVTSSLRQACTKIMNKDQARTNVVNEIFHAEREYVKNLRDVIEGYLEKARKRPEMFSPECLSVVFGNIEELYSFSVKFLNDLESQYNPAAPHLTEIGCSFLKHRAGFEVYSEFCNNHQDAMEELQLIQRNKKYKHFFEACRLLQQMIELPLEGFLLTPVQKICKYRLQLAELLKYTRQEHPDYRPLESAIYAMRSIAVLINERKRKIESLIKLSAWQDNVQDWDGEPIVTQSSELIHSGDLIKINSSGWSQERRFFLFDHQLVYCKKDLLWRDVMIYKGRIDLNHCQIFPISDGRKDGQFGVTTKHGFKIYDELKDKWYLIHGKSVAEKDRWLTAFEQERKRVKQDHASGYDLEPYRKKLCAFDKDRKPEDKNSNSSYERAQINQSMKPEVSTLGRHSNHPRQSIRSLTHLEHKKPHAKRAAWNIFRSKKNEKT